MIDAHRVPAATLRRSAILGEIIEKEDLFTRRADRAFKRAIDLASRFLEAEEM